MKKILMFLLLLLPSKVLALDIPNLNSNKVLVYDLTTNNIIYEKNSEIKTSIASITKIVTGMVAIEKIDDLDAEVNITKEMLDNIYWNASVAKLEVGDIVTYRDLLYALLLPSGADAAQALAISLSGSIHQYVLEMNDFVKRIGMINSNFVNITGLDANEQFSTLKDVLILIKYALNNPLFKEIFTTKEYILTNNLQIKSTLKGYSDKYGIDINRIIGSKTGNTDNAGTCLAAYFLVDNHELLSITVNAPKSTEIPYNLLDALNIIDYLDNNYQFDEEPITEDNKESDILKFKNKNTILKFKPYCICCVVLTILVLLIYKIVNYNTRF